MSSLVRTSISIPEETFQQLDHLCQSRGYRNRSHALDSIISQEFWNLTAEQGTGLMAGTLTMIVDEEKQGLLQKLSSLIRSRIEEVIASLSIPLENQRRMDIWVIQGPAQKLHAILQEVRALKGVLSSTVSFSPTLLPPIHERPRLNPSHAKRLEKQP